MLLWRDALGERSEGHAGHSCSVRFLSQVGLERVTSAARLRRSLVVSGSAATEEGCETADSKSTAAAAAPAVLSYQVAVAHFTYPTSLTYCMTTLAVVEVVQIVVYY